MVGWDSLVSLPGSARPSQLLTQRAKLVASLRIVRLIVSARRPQPVEVATTADVLRDQLHDRVGSLADRGPGCEPSPPHHRRVHVGGRMERVDDHPRPLQLGSEVDGEHDLRELALGVRAPTAEAVLDHELMTLADSAR